MKKTTKLNWLLLLAGFVFLYACTKNKNEIMPDAQPQRNQKEIAAKVVSWLEAQQPSNESGRNLTVSTLTDHLKLDGALQKRRKPGGGSNKIVTRFEKQPQKQTA